MGEGRGKGEEVGARQEGSNFTLETSLCQIVSFSPPCNLTGKWNDLHSTQKGTEVQRTSQIAVEMTVSGQENEAFAFPKCQGIYADTAEQGPD